jgi:hypothetical protein
MEVDVNVLSIRKGLWHTLPELMNVEGDKEEKKKYLHLFLWTGAKFQFIRYTIFMLKTTSIRISDITAVVCHTTLRQFSGCHQTGKIFRTVTKALFAV